MSLTINQVKQNICDKYGENYTVEGFKTSHDKCKIRCNELDDSGNKHEEIITTYKYAMTKIVTTICKACRIKETRTKLKEQFLVAAKKNPYINELNFDDFVYINQDTLGWVRCIICENKWKISPHNILHKGRCYTCHPKERNKNRHIEAKTNFISKLLYKNTTANLMDFSKCEYVRNHAKVTIICKRCNGEFYPTPANLLNNSSCPQCYDTSKGNYKIEQYLKNNSISFNKEHRFIYCKNRLPLPFDFYLSHYNICIEFDGEQHYCPIHFGGISKQKAIENFIKLQINDQIKNQYCKEHGIILIRIPYWDINNIESILEEQLGVIKSI